MNRVRVFTPLLAVLSLTSMIFPQEGTAPQAKADSRGFIAVGESGSVLFHPEKKVIETGGTFNLGHGFLEYLACGPGVKPHESLIALDCHPAELKLALILLGLREENARRPETDIDLRAIPGDRVLIFLRWTVEDAQGRKSVTEVRAEDCILNGLVSEPMQRVGWVFTGSVFIDEGPPAPVREDGDSTSPAPASPQAKKTFAPLLTGEFIALCHRPLSFLDHPLEIPFPDADYYANPEVLPKMDRDAPTPVTVTFRLPREGEIDKDAIRMRVPPPPKKL